MNIQEAIKSGKEFKRKHWDNWMKSDNNNYWLIWTTGKGSGKNIYEGLGIPDILADDYEIKEWYEGNFKEKYPHGVFCRVWISSGNKGLVPLVIYDYKKEAKYPFESLFDEWEFAEPIPEDKMPFILKEEK